MLFRSVLGDIPERVREAVRASLRSHLVSDVPVGVFLSGGIDSGVLTTLMSEMHRGGLTGITLSFTEFQGAPQDEVPAATVLANRFGIHQHIRIVTQEEFLEDLPRILEDMDQPSVDGINTWYASKAAAEVGLKVVISGVGGDELFQGYSYFRQIPGMVRLARFLQAIPGLRQVATQALNWRARRARNPRWSDALSLSQTVDGAWFIRRGSFSPRELPVLLGGDAAREVENYCPRGAIEAMAGPLSTNAQLAIGQMESCAYLRNQLLRDSDWASMSHSLELRTPLVDAWLLRELAPLLPAFHRFPGKSLLSGVTAEPLPNEILHRSKTGFSIPVTRWLHGHPEWGLPEPGSRGWAKVLVRNYPSTLGVS